MSSNIIKYVNDLKSFNINSLDFIIKEDLKYFVNGISFENVNFLEEVLDLSDFYHISYIYFKKCKFLENVNFPKDVKLLSISETDINGFKDIFKCSQIYINGFQDLSIINFEDIKKLYNGSDMFVHFNKCLVGLEDIKRFENEYIDVRVLDNCKISTDVIEYFETLDENSKIQIFSEY